MQAPAKLQADFLAQGNRVGAHLHFLAGGDARIGKAQVGFTDPAACQQRFAGKAFGLEGIENQ
ncbi:hypothetical protein D3C80_1380200 [compost metagenome]